MKKVISIFLAAAMLLSLAACGGTKQEEKQENTPEYVYAAQYTTLSEGTERYLNPQVFTEDGMYVSVWEKVGENIPEGAVVEYEGQYDVYENHIYFVSYQGELSRLEAYVPMSAEENNGKDNFYSSASLSGLMPGNDGSFYAIENVYSNWYDGPEGLTQYDNDYWMYMSYSEKYYLRKLAGDGSEISCVPIEVPEDKYINAYGAAVDSDGNLVMGLDMGIIAISPDDGSTVYSIEHSDYIDRMLRLSDGRMAALTWGETGMVLLPVANSSFGEPISLPYDAYNLYTGDSEYDFYYTSGINFFGYDIATSTATKLFNWIDCDVNSNILGKIEVTSDGRILGILNNWEDSSQTYTTELVTVSKVPYESVPHKETISLATVYLDYQVQSKIIDFNRHNDKYRIEVRDYSEYNSDEDYSAGLTKLKTEIMAGNMPDIIALDGSLPYTQLAAKGLLEDLYPFIDSDSQFNRDDFFQNVLGTLEVDGKLYSTVSGFYINTVIGASSVVGDTPGWTYDDFDAALASMPEGCEPFDQYMTRNSMLNTCLALDMQYYVDWTNGKCNFDSESFVQLLEFANRFPAEYVWDESTVYESTSDRIKQGKQMLQEYYLFSIDDMMYNDSNFGGDMTYIGYPTNSGTGSTLNLETCYAMSSSCKNKEAAWSFLRMFFTEEYQNTLYSLPSNINVYNAKLEKAMTPQYVKDTDGNFVLNESGDKIPVIQYSFVNPDGTVTELYAMTQQQADRLWDVVTTTSKRSDYNTEIIDIVMEQAEAYFSGQKSAEEVARLIQSKANIYVNEQR